MTNIPSIAGRGTASLEQAFIDEYQNAGLPYLLFTCLIVYFAYGTFWLADYAAGALPLAGGVQTFRLSVIGAALLTHLTVLMRPKFARANYPALAGAFYLMIVQATAYSAFLSRWQAGPAELYWSLTSSVLTATIVLYAFARLPARVSLLIAGSGMVACLIYALQIHDAPLDRLTRLIVHLLIVNLVGYLLQRSLVSRERGLFFMAQENLRQNQYAAQLQAHAQELAEQRTRADAANTAKDRFLATMSHEIRTPMNAIVGALRLLPSQLPVPAGKASELLQVALRSSEALLGVLNDVLDFARIAKGQVTVAANVFDPRHLLTASVGVFETAAKAKGLRMEVDVSALSDHLHLKGDHQKIRQILLNLTSNAVKFTDQGVVRARAFLQNSDANPTQLVITIADTGIGIPVAFQPRLYEPFSQADLSDTRPAGGTGLGLAIVNDLVRALDGTIRFSTSERGTEFVVSVPIERVEPGALAQPPSPDQTTLRVASPPVTLRVLIAEDNRINAQITGFMLDQIGIEHRHAEDGVQAVSRFRDDGPFDLILMDCQMPNLDGFAATSAIRQLETAQQRDPTPIVALTADVSPAARDRCFEVGMNGFLAKPVEIEVLQQTIYTHVAHRDALRRAALPANPFNNDA